MMTMLRRLIELFFTSPIYAGFMLMFIGVFSLSFALISQYGFGYAPCELCIYQRWPYGIVIALGLLAVLTGCKRPKFAAMLMALAGFVFLVGMAIAFYHSGVEQKWWAGMASCTTANFIGQNLSLDELEALIMAAPVVSCGDIAWTLFGLSMAVYNTFLSLLYAGYGFLAAIFITRRVNHA